MTAMDFPLNPNDGDTHDNYVYDATHGVWNQNPQQLAARFIASDTAPTSPSTGDAWFDTETGKTYVYHDSSWVESGNPVIGYVDPYDQDSTSTGYFSLPSGTTAQRPVTPSNGDIRFNTTLGEPEYYSEAAGNWFVFRQSPTFEIEYLVIAGGGGAGAGHGGAGGAGGYRSSVVGDSSGGGQSAEAKFLVSSGTGYSVTVGGGGAGGVGYLLDTSAGSIGENSSFASITSIGGGRGGGYDNNTGPDYIGGDGGSGGGGVGQRDNAFGGSGQAGQGYPGGQGNNTNNNGSSGKPGGGGGGAGQSGSNASEEFGGNGGDGISSSITGTSIARAGGGGGGSGSQGTAGGSGGTGGGGDGEIIDAVAGGNGENNKGGGGGGGAGNNPAYGGNGGSGVVIIKYPSEYSITAGSGLTSPITNTVGDYKVTQFTGGTDTIIFS